MTARLGRRSVERAIRTGELVVVRRGIVAGAKCVQDYAFRVRVRQARIRGLAVAGHGTAAALHGLDRLGRPPATVRLLKPTGGSWQDNDVSVRVAQLPPGHVTTIEQVLADCREWPGLPQARAAVAFASPLAESVLESVSRAVSARAGLPTPQLQVDVGDADGFIGRVDFLWQAQRVVGEAHGLSK